MTTHILGLVSCVEALWIWKDIPDFAPPSMPNENSPPEPMEDSLDIEIDRFMNFEGSKTLLAQKLNKRFS